MPTRVYTMDELFSKWVIPIAADRPMVCQETHVSVSPPAAATVRATGSRKKATCSKDTKVRAWLIDTGCGFDLVSKADVKPIQEYVEPTTLPQTFSTANGAVDGNHQCPIQIDELSDVA